MKLLNLACGRRFHPDWTNVDIVSSEPGVMIHDLTKGIPFPDASYDVVYASHILEHLRRPDALNFINECYRVLTPGGILRIVVPDLEQICRLYLQKLNDASSGDTTGAHDYEWMLLEMYDQTVREHSGGRMAEYMSQDPIPNERFVHERIGEEAREMIRWLKKPPPDTSVKIESLLQRLRNRFLTLPGSFHHRLVRLLLGKEGMRALEIGRLRIAGEVHQWMYDRYSLTQLLLKTGFVDPIRKTAQTSLIPDWRKFQLDVLRDGTVIKPDSLYMEAVKPA